jgi:hypothetical protein
MKGQKQHMTASIALDFETADNYPASRLRSGHGPH